MPSLFMLRTPGRKDFPTLAHLVEGRVYDNVSKDDADTLFNARLAEEFDGSNELHVKAVEEFNHLDARKTERPLLRSGARSTAAYDDMTVEDLHAEASKRNLEGRSGLTTKADLVKALEKDDKAKGAKK